MPPKITFIIDSDPRTSPRPAEAVRIAAGVVAWKKVAITVYLRGPAVRALGESSDELVDGEQITRCLPMIVAGGQPIYVERGAPLLAGARHSPVPFEEISDLELAARIAAHNHVLRF